MEHTAETSVIEDDWSLLSAIQPIPSINFERLMTYRLARIREQLRLRSIPACVLISPISQRYAADIRCWPLFQAHVPMTYLYIAAEGPVINFGSADSTNPAGFSVIDEARPARSLDYFSGGPRMQEDAVLFAAELRALLRETTDENQIAVEYVNPSATQALMNAGLRVVDAQPLMEHARVVKSEDEIECMKWSIAVAEHGVAKIAEVLRPGVRENQLWGLLNYANLANDGDWHETRLLSSGPRTNPWFQEASDRRIEAGDLVGFDTDMIGPFGYCCDLSRTLHCGPVAPTQAQRDLYKRSYDEILANTALLKAGRSFRELSEQGTRQPERFQRYSQLMHAVGLCDEYPRIPFWKDWNNKGYEGELEAGTIMCVESYLGEYGGREGVKLEEQVLITKEGIEVLTQYPFEDKLLA
ncbi:MAG: aminopeptidase P family protein [Mesorhizobium sp.]|uniref:M24 family metallopeptidase n=1 Tax=Mesorhizobium sp. TaxID=1871066 RepID=UPI000FE94DC9|nr:Xaa-Pro peptidase family protein [Mesorhizobium sp.]RWE19965.1 MAG: aminopeptidase P family protein [Mesorhizobium sp.]